jgi:hypothetical protein
VTSTGPRKHGRRIERPAACAPHGADQFFKEQGDAERHEQAEQRLLAVERSQQARFDQHPGSADEDRRQHDGPGTNSVAQRQREICAEREEHAVREIHHAEHAEDD